MALGLSVSDLVNVEVSLSPLAIPLRNFGILLILGPSPVIDINERLRQYSTLSQVATDFGTSAPEYMAAAAFFSQNPQPAVLDIGRWAQGGSAGVLYGGIFTPSQQATLLSSLTAITTGSMSVSVDGTPHALTGLSFSGAVSLNGAAGIIATALPSANVIWDSTNGRFQITSKTSGTSSSVTYATPTGSGVDVSATLKLTSATGASLPVAGIAAETPVQAAAIFAAQRSDWYGLTFAPANPGDIVSSDYQAVAALIEGQNPARIFGITSQDPAIGNATSTTDLGYILSSAKYNRTFIQYSSTNPFAVCSFIGRNFTTDFSGNNTVMDIMYKQEPGITAETITETFASALRAKNVNVFVNYANGAAIIQFGTMASGQWFDVVYTTDWYANALQTGFFNALYTVSTKLPQTEAGVNVLVAVAEQVGDQATSNGMLAPGIWNGPPLGGLNTGNAMTKGYYTYSTPLAKQSQADREARKAPLIQQAIKLAGSIHTVDCLVTVNQ